MKETQIPNDPPQNLALSPPDRDIDSDVYVLVFADYCIRTKEALVIAYARNANLCYVFSEPPKFRCKAPPDRDIDSDVYVLVFAD